MTFLQLQYNVYRRLGFADSPASDVSTRVKQSLNEIYRRVMSLPGMEAIRPVTTTLTTVANVARYGIDYSVARISAIRDSTNKYKLRGESFQWYTDQAPDPSTVLGRPEVWVLTGHSPVYLQPSDSSEIVFKSSGADTTQTLYIEGIKAGVYTATSASLNGTSSVTLGTAWTEIDKLYVNAVCVGVVTVYEDSTSGTALAALPIGKTHFRYMGVALWPTPSSALTLYVDGFRSIPDLSNTTDEPQLPEDFHYILSDGARMLEYEKQDDTRYGAAKSDYENGVKRLKYWLHTQADNRSTMHGGYIGSRLGPWYPRGS